MVIKLIIYLIVVFKVLIVRINVIVMSINIYLIWLIFSMRLKIIVIIIVNICKRNL